MLDFTLLHFFQQLHLVNIQNFQMYESSLNDYKQGQES
jgi:hypothetical protein